MMAGEMSCKSPWVPAEFHFSEVRPAEKSVNFLLPEIRFCIDYPVVQASSKAATMSVSLTDHLSCQCIVISVAVNLNCVDTGTHCEELGALRVEM